MVGLERKGLLERMELGCNVLVLVHMVLVRMVLEPEQDRDLRLWRRQRNERLSQRRLQVYLVELH